MRVISYSLFYCFITIVLSTTASNAQDIPIRPNAYDGDSLKTGDWVYYYDEGWENIPSSDGVAYYRLITYENGKPIGKMRDYYASGQIQMEGTLFNENPEQFEGELIYYSVKGHIEDIRIYEKGVLNYHKSIARNETLIATQGKTILDSVSFAILLNNLARIYLNRGRYAESIPLLKQALKIRKEQLGENHPSYAISLNNLGLLYSQMGRYAETEPLYKQALKIYKEQLEENHPEYVTSLNNLGLLYSKMGRYAEAELLFKQALKIIKEQLGENHPDYAISLNNLALVYKRMGRYAEAEPFYMQALKINKEQLGENHQIYSTNLNNLAVLYDIMGRYAESEQLYKQALKITKEQLGENHPEYALSLNNLAGSYSDMGRYTEAEPLYKQSLKIEKEQLGENHPYYATSLNDLAILYKRMSRYTEAEPLYMQALKIRKEQLGENHPSYGISLYSLAGLYQAMDTLPETVLSYYQQDLSISKETFGSDSRDVAGSKRALARFYYHKGQTESALPLFVENLEFRESYLQEYFDYLGESEREAFYKTIKSNFEQYAELSFREQKDHPELLSTTYNLQLRYKALLLNTTNQVKKRILSSGDRRLISLYDEVQALKQLQGQTASLSDEELLTQRGVKRDSIRQLIQTKDEQLTRFSGFYKAENKLPNWQDVQAKLGKKEAAVEVIRYRVYDYRRQEFTDTVKYAAFVITEKTKEYPKVVLFGDGNYLEMNAISLYRKSIQYKLDDKHSYGNFWKPLQNELKKIDKVYFAPDGVINSVNMKTLYNPETGNYLRDEISLELVTSGKDLLREQSDRLPQKIGLLIGNPAFGGEVNEKAEERSADFTNVLASLERGEGLSPLPGTEKEVQIIEELLKKNNWRQTTLLNADATEDELKNMLKPNILHIATHGFFQADVEGEIKYNTNPLYRSGLLLSGAAETLGNKSDLRGNVQMGKEDGILTAFEALNLNIDNTDLVVLSACETGLGEIRNGEGVYGLQRAFKLAGARTILMSLWKVNDQTTQELMVSFYENWLGGMSKRAAFNTAQLQLKAKYEHPYYWGAFVLIGE